MRSFSLIALLLMSAFTFAQSEGDKKDIDGQKFTYSSGTWVHDALGDSFKHDKRYTAIHRDKTWKKWYSEGSPTLKKILDLGPNVAFKFKGADSQFHTYSVFPNKNAMAAVFGGSGGGGATAAAGGAKLSNTAWWLIGGAAVITGAVIIDNNKNESE